MNGQVSNCCGALLRVAGDTTQYYVCPRCEHPCDAASYDRMIARTQDGPDPLVPEPGPGKGT